jgi:hypothetical protein
MSAQVVCRLGFVRRPVAVALDCMFSECRVVWTTIDTPSNSMHWQSNVRISHLLAHVCACGFRRAHTVRLSVADCLDNRQEPQVAGRPFGLVPSHLFEGRKRRAVPLTRTEAYARSLFHNPDETNTCGWVCGARLMMSKSARRGL